MATKKGEIESGGTALMSPPLAWFPEREKSATAKLRPLHQDRGREGATGYRSKASPPSWKRVEPLENCSPRKQLELEAGEA